MTHRFRAPVDGSAPLVMGIVNVTPDSFADGGRHQDEPAAIAHAHRLIGEGADIVDIGGESTRPGAAPVSVDEELARVLPVIEALQDVDAAVSVDTSKPQVMRAAVAAGADIINDVNALRSPGALQAAAVSGAAVCLMHMRGTPRTMQDAPTYDDVVAEVKAFLAERVAACLAAGFERGRLILDPGFGFGKTVDHNLKLLKYLDQFLDLKLPILAGLSRKAMLHSVTGRAVDDRLFGSVALAALAIWQGAAIVRVHDVAATVDAVRVARAVRGV